MDSLTQIVLGAAVGEAVAGRKIGSRAMVWGGIAGTIPDLDVLANLWMREIDALAVHRGITHSIFFSLVAPLVFGWLIKWLYDSGFYRSAGYKWFVGGLNSIIILLFVVGNYWVTASIPALIVLAIAGGYLIWRLFKYYIKAPATDVEMSYGRWYLLFFAGFSTHILLDAFTAYGTQWYLPFSNHRVAFNTISVVDPFYTIPFLVCLVAAALHRRNTPRRVFFNWLGIGLSTLYLLATVVNKGHINRVYEDAYEKREINYSRYRTSPTIFNNILWNGVAETPEGFYSGMYSMLDSQRDIHTLNYLERDQALVDSLSPLDEFQTLEWFSDGYYIVTRNDSAVEFMDIRYGAMTDTITSNRDFVFRFIIEQHAGRIEVHQVNERPDDAGKMLKNLLRRIKGY